MTVFVFDKPCAVASVAANPLGPSAEADGANEYAGGAAETLFEMASRIGIAIDRSGQHPELAGEECIRVATARERSFQSWKAANAMNSSELLFRR